jgi:hypothetical protein
VSSDVKRRVSQVADSSGPGLGQEETAAAASAMASGGGGGAVLEAPSDDPSVDGRGGGLGGASHLDDRKIDDMNMLQFG